MKRVFFFILLLAMMTPSYGQKEYWNWYFGQNAAINFSTSPPNAMTNSALSTLDQTSSISDSLGNLLMYTDGINMYNKYHGIMANGNNLMGSTTTYGHSSIIVRKPGSGSVYYVFMLTYFGYAGGLQYAIVDMTLNGGLGQVVSKNNMLLTPVCEKLTAITHQNGIDVWVITHKWGTNEFYSFLLTSGGIQSPVITAIGTAHSGSTNNAQGQLAASHDGIKIAIGTYGQSFFGIYNFDKSTGNISNEIKLLWYPRSWGVQFSPDVTKLYATCWTDSNIYQFDITSGNATTIEATETIVGVVTSPDPQYKAGFLQLGPDNKIYVAKMTSPYIGVISNPNASGLACNYTDNAIHLSGKICEAGLPNDNITQRPPPGITAESFCARDTTFFTGYNLYDMNFIQWDFGDPASGINNNSSEVSPSHYYSAPGTYYVSVYTRIGSIADTLRDTITILMTYDTELGTDTLLCAGDSLALTAGTPGFVYHWSTGDTSNSIVVTNNGSYSVVMGPSNSCQALDTINVQFHTNYVNLIDSIELCNGDTTVLNPGFGFTNFNWQDGSQQSTFLVNHEGIYSVTVQDINGCESADSTYVDYKSAPVVDLGQDNDFCNYESYFLNAGNAGPFSTYLWQDGSISQFFTVYTSGTYYVMVENECGKDMDTVVFENCPLCNIEVPNAFSPNNDGMNDDLHVLGEGFFNLHLIIYNRYGQQVFETFDPGIAWNGSFQGQMQENEVYYYYLTADCIRGGRITKKGDITLFK